MITKFIILSLFVVFFSGCATQQICEYKPAPVILKNVNCDMKTPEFWIQSHPSPDKIILNSSQIENFNKRIYAELNLTSDIFSMSSLYNGQLVLNSISEQLNHFKDADIYFEDGSKVQNDFFKNIENNICLANIHENIPVKFGIIIRFSSQRLLPTDQGLYKASLNTDFDELQNSGLDISTPVAVVHTTLDGKWSYVFTDLSEGWIKSADIAEVSVEELQNYSCAKDFVVVTAAKCKIFLDKEFKNYLGYVRMGVTMPFVKEGKILGVKIPVRDESGRVIFKNGYINSGDVNQGFLTYTPQNIINQAFKLLDAPYGWGDANGEQDCSRFIQEIFATVGIKMPRNSAAQSRVGISLGEFLRESPAREKLECLKNKAVSGITILYLKGHIMLYLGCIKGEPYAIHAYYGYGNKITKKTVYVVNKVSVTDLSLGQGSAKGSLLERVLRVVRI